MFIGIIDAYSVCCRHILLNDLTNLIGGSGENNLPRLSFEKIHRSQYSPNVKNLGMVWVFYASAEQLVLGLAYIRDI